jgi:hypothetical protein
MHELQERTLHCNERVRLREELERVVPRVIASIKSKRRI